MKICYVAKNTDKKISCSKESILKNMWETTQIKKIIIHVPKMPKKKKLQKRKWKNNCIIKTQAKQSMKKEHIKKIMHQKTQI